MDWHERIASRDGETTRGDLYRAPRKHLCFGAEGFFLLLLKLLYPALLCRVLPSEQDSASLMLELSM